MDIGGSSPSGLPASNAPAVGRVAPAGKCAIHSSVTPPCNLCSKWRIFYPEKDGEIVQRLHRVHKTDASEFDRVRVTAVVRRGESPVAGQEEQPRDPVVLWTMRRAGVGVAPPKRRHLGRLIGVDHLCSPGGRCGGRPGGSLAEQA